MLLLSCAWLGEGVEMGEYDRGWGKIGLLLASSRAGLSHLERVQREGGLGRGIQEPIKGQGGKGAGYFFLSIRLQCRI